MSKPSEVEGILEDLQEVRSLISAGWCQNKHARDSSGADVGILSIDASSYCLLGAVQRVTLLKYSGEEITKRYIDLASRLQSAIRVIDESHTTVASWNDARERKKEEVLSAIDKAIDGVRP